MSTPAHPPAQEKAPARPEQAAPGNKQEHRQTTTTASQGKHFDTEVLEGLRARLPEYLNKIGIELKKQGSRLVGRCPMHDDSSPSFAVFGAKLENCGCIPCNDFKGDVFAASQWLGRAGSFTEAVREVAATLGAYLPQDGTRAATRAATAPQRAPKQPEVPFALSDSDKEKIHAAKLAWSDAFHGGDSIVGFIAEDLGLSRETLRYAGHGSSGLGIANGWLCYAYPQGLKWRNPDPQAKPRFLWLCGKATLPWRWEWARLPDIRTIYVCEGESDCLALIEAGLESDGTGACVASPGTSFSPEWAMLFAGKAVILCFDSDPPGQTAALKVAAMLAPHATSVSIAKGPLS